VFSFWINAIYSCNGKVGFPASLPQPAVSYDPSEIILIWWFGDQYIFPIIIINVENICAAFVEAMRPFFQDSQMNRNAQKNSFYLKSKYF